MSSQTTEPNGDEISPLVLNPSKRSAEDLNNDDSLSPQEIQASKKLNTSRINIEPSTTMGPPKNTSTSKNVPSTNIIFNVPTNNQFSDLNTVSNNTTIKNIADAKVNKKHTEKIPPITVVGATNFANAISIVSESAKDNYFLKYMSIGVKIQVTKFDNYNEIKTRLINANIEFYSHDVNPEKYEQFILSGIHKVEINVLTDELTSKGFIVSAINEIPVKQPRFSNEGLYRVTLKGSVDLKKLSKTHLNHTVVKWKRHERRSKITQCRRCQNFGHGIRNCNISFKCSKCGSNHESSTCTADFLKCANCGGEHDANANDCPKRISFLEMRQKMSSKNNAKKSLKEAPQLENLSVFPELKAKTSNFRTTRGESNQRPSNNPWSFGPFGYLKKKQSSNPHNIETTVIVPPAIPESDSSKGAHPTLFEPDMIGIIFGELLRSLKDCQSKEQQLQVMFEIATKYIYNNVP